jgi:hypothetical protein
MGSDSAGQREYRTLLEFLEKKVLEIDDVLEKRRIQNLLNGEADSHVMSEFIAKLKTDAAKEIVSAACLTFLTKHVLNLSIEFKNLK